MRNEWIEIQKTDTPAVYEACRPRRKGLDDTVPELALVRRGMGADAARAAMAQAGMRLDENGVLLKWDPHFGDLVYVPSAGKMSNAHGHTVSFREAMLLRAHLEVHHAGALRTFQQLQQLGCWWGTAWNECQKFVDRCILCGIAERRVSATARALPRGFDRYIGLGRVWSVDHFGPLPADALGYKYILTIRDHGSGFPWMVACKSKRCEEAADRIIEIGLSFGMPMMIRSDRGFGGEGPESLQHYLSQHGILCTATMPYTPTANTLAEGIHKPLRRALEKFVLINGKPGWTKVLPYFLYSLRTAPQPSLGGRSSFELMFGRQPRKGVAELITGFGGSGEADRLLAASIEFRKEAHEAMGIAAEQLNAARATTDKAATTTVRLNSGDLVVLQNQSRSRTELQPRNYPVLFRVSDTHQRFVTLKDLHGDPARGRASGKIPSWMVSKVLSKEHADSWMGLLGPSIPTTEEMLGDMSHGFMMSVQTSNQNE